MASKTAIKDDVTYRVTLTKSISVGRAIVHPRPGVTLRGDLLKSAIAADAAAVADYEVWAPVEKRGL